MARGKLVVLVSLLLVAPWAGAASVVVLVDDGRAPLADAVVELAAPALPEPAATTAPHVIDQKDETFIPFLTLMRRGESVVFRNSDYTRHHVYTFSPVRPFEFVVPSNSSSEPVVFERSGVAAIGCNIHDRMIAYVFVSNAAFAARSDSDGRVRFELPPGQYGLRVWHPRLRSGSRGVEREMAVPATGETEVAVSLRVSGAPPAGDRERTSY